MDLLVKNAERHNTSVTDHNATGHGVTGHNAIDHNAMEKNVVELGNITPRGTAQ